MATSEYIDLFMKRALREARDEAARQCQIAAAERAGRVLAENERDEARRVAGVLADALATHDVDETTGNAIDIALLYPQSEEPKAVRCKHCAHTYLDHDWNERCPPALLPEGSPRRVFEPEGSGR